MDVSRSSAGGQSTSLPQFTRDEPKGISRFSNRVQGLAYGGASALVVIIGLRSIYGRQIPSWIVIGALVLEALLLLMIATVYYLTPEEKGGAAPSTDSQILTGEKEILHLLKRDIITGEIEMIRVLKNDIAGGLHELLAFMRNEFLSSQREMYNALSNELNTLRSEIINGEAEALRVLQQIETHIGKIVENEIERVVQEKVQEVFTAMVRQEAHKSLEANSSTKA